MSASICLSVRLVGNGGGYAYGSMGATHHALEDYGVLLTLPALRAYVPAFDADVAPMVRSIAERDAPAYLRLGRSERATNPRCPPTPRGVGCRRAGRAVGGGRTDRRGPVEAARERPLAERPAFWVVSELEGDWRAVAPPPAVLDELAAGPVLGIVEEHVAQGSFGQQFLHFLALRAARWGASCMRMRKGIRRAVRLAALASAGVRAGCAGHPRPAHSAGGH